MKKLLTLTLAFSFALLITGCNKENPQANTNPNNETEINCFTLCNETILEKCEDEIVEYEANDVPVLTNDTIYNNEFCEAQCATWTPEVMKCIHNAKSCEQIGPEAEYCITTPPEDPFEYPEEVAENKNCDKACKNYGDCAGLADDATTEDIQEAYNSCYSECQGWSEKTIKCMSDAGSSPMGCATLSMCGLQEYQGMIDSMN
ncbi:hypothetical protein KKF73_03705 [Patescibacteria group bacterium]|nr:hypothetical protein [Patescibacteria group bacterium]